MSLTSQQSLEPNPYTESSSNQDRSSLLCFFAATLLLDLVVVVEDTWCTVARAFCGNEKCQFKKNNTSLDFRVASAKFDVYELDYNPQCAHVRGLRCVHLMLSLEHNTQFSAYLFIQQAVPPPPPACHAVVM